MRIILCNNDYNSNTCNYVFLIVIIVIQAQKKYVGFVISIIIKTRVIIFIIQAQDNYVGVTVCNYFDYVCDT